MSGKLPAYLEVKVMKGLLGTLHALDTRQRRRQNLENTNLGR